MASKSLLQRSLTGGGLALVACLLAPPSWADHLPPGVQVMHMRQPQYLDKRPPKDKFTPEDISEAKELAALGDAEAQNNLGNMLVSLGDYKHAEYWYRQACDQGIADAFYNLGALYFNGTGVPQDFAHALQLFQEGAKRGSGRAAFQIALMYYGGKGVPADAQQELYWYRQAARQRLAAADYNLAVMYHNGEGVQADDVQAYAWLLLAKDGGMDTADAEQEIGNNLTANQKADAVKLSNRLPDSG